MSMAQISAIPGVHRRLPLLCTLDKPMQLSVQITACLANIKGSIMVTNYPGGTDTMTLVDSLSQHYMYGSYKNTLFAQDNIQLLG